MLASRLIVGPLPYWAGLAGIETPGLLAGFAAALALVRLARYLIVIKYFILLRFRNFA